MADHVLISMHLAVLRRRLPAEVVEELSDGLTETYQHHRTRGLDPATAAAAAIADFGDPDQITAAFTKQAPSRRTAMALLATAPLYAACWGTSLIISRAWTWPIPAAAGAAFGLALLGVAALFVTAASARSYPRTRLAVAGGVGLVGLDAAMLAAVLLAAPALEWPMAIAIPASLTRIAFTVRALPRMLPARP